MKAEYERKNILNFVRCKSMAHMKISIVVLSDNWTAEHFARKSEIAEDTAWSYIPSITFAREGYFSRCLLDFSSQVRIYLIKLFCWVSSKFRRVCVAIKRFPCDSSGIAFIDSRPRVYAPFAYDLLMHVPTQSVSHDTLSQLTSSAFAVAALKVIEMDSHLGRRKKVKHFVALIRIFL